MKRITFIISDIDKALPFEWLAVALKDEYHLEFLLLRQGDSALQRFLKKLNIPAETIDERSYLKLWLKLRKHLRQSKPDIVHCHLRKAEIAGIPASLSAGIKNRIFTRHSSTYNHLYHKKGVWVDKRINRLATGIVAISKTVSDVLTEREGVSSNKVHLIHHGFDLNYFRDVSKERIKKVADKYSIGDKAHVIGVIARFTFWKGFKSIIPAFRLYLQNYPDTTFIFANATGNNAVEIKKLLKEKLPPENFREIPYEEDIAAIYHLMDFYVHTPINPEVEAFGQTYVEALAAGIPSVFTKSGIAREFIEDGQNALVVPFNDPSALCDALIRLKKEPELSNKLSVNGWDSVQEFSLEPYIRRLKNLYNSL